MQTFDPLSFSTFSQFKYHSWQHKSGNDSFLSPLTSFTLEEKAVWTSLLFHFAKAGNIYQNHNNQ